MIDEAAVTRRLILDENEVLHAYPDSKGYLTCCVGRMIDPRKGGGFSQDESRYLLRNDVHRFHAECEQRFDWWDSLDPVRQGCIVCMAFQLGTGGVANFYKMIAAIKARDYAEAAAQMLDSDWHKDTEARCERMAQIMKSGEWL